MHHVSSDCRTEQGNTCVFPFTYKGVTYKSCTTAESDNNKAWCATEVDTEGVVVNNQWQDCAEVRHTPHKWIMTWDVKNKCFKLDPVVV